MGVELLHSINKITTIRLLRVGLSIVHSVKRDSAHGVTLYRHVPLECLQISDQTTGLTNSVIHRRTAGQRRKEQVVTVLFRTTISFP